MNSRNEERTADHFWSAIDWLISIGEIAWAIPGALFEWFDSLF